MQTKRHYTWKNGLYDFYSYTNNRLISLSTLGEIQDKKKSSGVTFKYSK